MNSEDYQFNPDQTASAQPEQPAEKRIHPDTLKFMGMAKNLLESPEIKQSIASEQQKAEPSSSQEYSVSSTSSADQSNPTPPAGQSTSSSEDQPDTLDFRGMARDLLSNPARQSTEAES